MSASGYPPYQPPAYPPSYPLPMPPPPDPGYGHAYRYASLGARFGAALIDLLLLAVIAVVVAIPFGVLTALAVLSHVEWAGVVGLFWGPFTLVLIVAFFAYYIYYESTTGQTLGKRAAGIRVIALATGRPPDLGQALIRNVLRIVDWLPFLYFLGFFVAALTERRQRLGDLLAETVVVPA